jgi:hypothetical protein
VPLDTLTFRVKAEAEPTDAHSDGEGWRPTQPKRPRHKGVPFVETLRSCHSIGGLVYRPETLTHLLGIDRSLLPLFAALVGTDYGSFFDGQSSGSNRPSSAKIQRVANVLSKAKAEQPVADLIRNALQDLLVIYPSRLSTDEILDALVPAIAQYTEAPRVEMASFARQPLDSPERVEIKRRLSRAYANGRLLPSTLEILERRSLIVSPVLEDPSLRSSHVRCTGDVRRWVYAVLQDALSPQDGDAPGVEEESAEESAGDDGDSKDDEADGGTGRFTSLTEHLRLGERLGSRIIEVEPLADLLVEASVAPLSNSDVLLSSPYASRLRIFLAAFKSSGILGEDHSALPPLIPLAASLRLLALAPERSEAWTRAQRRAALAAGVLLFLDELLPVFVPVSPPVKPYIQRSSELVHTLVTARLLSDVLLLSDTLDSPHRFFHGPLLHFFLGSADSDGDGTDLDRHLSSHAKEMLERLSRVMEEGLPPDPPQPRSKKKTKPKNDGTVEGNGAKATGASSGTPANLFELLSLSDGS